MYTWNTLAIVSEHATRGIDPKATSRPSPRPPPGSVILSEMAARLSSRPVPRDAPPCSRRISLSLLLFVATSASAGTQEMSAGSSMRITWARTNPRWILLALAILPRLSLAPFPHLPQRIRIHNQYTPRPVVPFMVLCIVTAAINPLRATETSASRFHLFCAFFAAYVAHLFSPLFSDRCTLFVHSLAPERKSTRVFSCVCALFCKNMGGGGLCHETPRVIINFQTPKYSLGETL